ncbi:class I SAM-dependent methyltransferase, partial [Mycolicibacterium farcinogenes]|nr:class I SAM-dependent methyltransferase [Mycolicibacterium farcinogenes]
PVTEDELREVVGKYWVIDDVRPARIHANVPPEFANFADFAGADIRDEGNNRKSMAAWLLQAHLG